MINEQNKKEQSNVESDISPAQVMDKIQQAIESDKDLSAGHLKQLHETTRSDNPCSRTFRAIIGVSVVIYNES
jgi:hypothetical protein